MRSPPPIPVAAPEPHFRCSARGPGLRPGRLACAALWLSVAVARGQTAPCEEVRTFAEGRVPRREIFVAVDGNDTQGVGSRGRPFRSVARAAAGAPPGTAIRLLPGQYEGGHTLANVAGTAEAPIWLGGVPGEARPHLQGGTVALQLTKVRHVVVEHLEVSRARGNGINCDDGADYANAEATRFVLFRDLFIHDIGTGGNQDALKLSGVNDYWVLDCRIARGSAGGSGIDHVGCHRGVIARCRFEALGSNAIQCKGGSEDIEIRWCRFVNGGQRAVNLGGSTGFEFFRPPLSATQTNVEARNIRVWANLFEGSDAPVAFVGSVDCLVAHNTFVDPTRWVVRILQETVSRSGFTFAACGSSRFINNLVYFRRSGLSTIANVGANTAPDSFTFEHNLWYAHDQPGRSAPSLPVAEANAVVGLDPGLANPGGGDFRIGPGSPAAGQGKRLPAPRGDFGQRCFASPPAIGAYEAQPSAPIP